MKITYNKNPLRTTVELDEHEREMLKLKIKLEELEDIAYSGYHTLTHHKWWNEAVSKNGAAKPMRTLEDTVAEAVKELNPDYWIEDDSKLNARVEDLLQHYIEELAGWHCGDCTCVPCSCSKCHAEGVLGINTTKGLDKYSAHKINTAFGKDNERTIDEALDYLANYGQNLEGPTNPEDKERWDRAGGWEKHVPRWTEEAKQAYEWLLAYRNEHFPKEQ